MPIHHQLEIRTGDLPLSGAGDAVACSGLARRSKRAFHALGEVLQAFVAIAISAGLCTASRPLGAQEAIRTQLTPSAVISGAHADAIGPERGPSKDASSVAGGGTATQPATSPLSTISGTISGTVFDLNGDLIPGANVEISDGSTSDRREVVANDNGAFKFDMLNPGISYSVSVHAKGFVNWTSPAIVLEPSQFFILDNVHLKLEAEATSITVYGSTEQIAVEQVRLEEQQRVLGFIPNIYVVYDSANAVPLNTKLKFRLAMKVAINPVSWAGIGFMAGMRQAANEPEYQQGSKGYGQRFGAEAANGLSDMMLGGAILPSLLHQDPRYFYQGTGTTSSRLKHAMKAPFICRGDNGKQQINFSSLGGDLGSSALAMAYYPEQNRSAGDVLGTFAISTFERVGAAIAQEFIIPRFTTRGKPSR